MVDLKACVGHLCSVGHYPDGMRSIVKPYFKRNKFSYLRRVSEKNNNDRHLLSLRIDGCIQTV